MIVTEEEAKKMFCPIAGGKCVGSECMGWKFVIDYIPMDKAAEVTPLKTVQGDQGYCGMVKE